jgi:hypothetical protein
VNHFTQYPQRYRTPAPSGAGAGWIIVCCILWTLLAPVPGPIDDLIVWAFGAYSAMRGRSS